MADQDLEKELALVFEGRKQLREVLEFSPDRLAQLTELAYLLFEEGRYEEARVMFEGLVALDMSNPYFYRALGAVSQRLGKNDAAVRYYQRALKLNDSEPEVWGNMGELLLVEGEMERAVSCLEKAEMLFRLHQPKAAQRRRVQALLKTYRRVAK
jgi:Flp pilus assembly protein TadD